ncbi:MAG: OmpA family protein [Betaproteobacteria bacterium]|nr:OmpA family protein [Betaproteobacteria bacterium]
MTQRLVTGVLVGAIATVFAGGVAAQAQPKVTTGYVPGTAPASDGYVQSGTALTPTDGTVKSGVYNGDKGLAGNLCYRTGYWTPSMATKECDPDLVPKPPAPAPAPAPAAKPAPPAPAPAPAPAAKPAAPGVQKITLASKALFDFDKAVLKPEGKAAIDTEIIAKLKDVQKLELVLVTGHTDRIGTQAYNQKLSERRANAVRDYLVSKGVAKDKIETLGMGKTQPIPAVKCEMKAMKELIACLAPNRRVEVEVKGEAIKR